MKTLMIKRNNDVISGMFLPSAIAMILSTTATFIANTVDGLVTSNFLGSTAFSAVSLFTPMVSMMLLFTYFVGVGGQVLCSAKVGVGEKEEANAVFTFSLIVGLFFSAVFVLIAVFSPDIIFRICGVTETERPELYEYIGEYLRGYCLGIPSLIMVQILEPFLIIDNRKKLISISAAVLCITDIAFDFINVLVFKGGVFGMGLATSISLTLQLIVLLFHFAFEGGYFRLSLKGFRAGFLKTIIKSGGLSFMRSMATTLRELFTNHLNLAVAVGTAAIAARGIQGDINRLMFCISIGMGKAILPMTSMYYGADDKNGIKRLFSYSMKVSAYISGGVGAILFLLAPIIVNVYTDDTEITSLAVFGIRCMAAGLIFDTVLVAYQSYLQGIQRIKLVNILCFAERFFIPVIIAWVLGMSFGSKGVLASVAIGKVVLGILILFIIWANRKEFPRKMEDYMFLPKEFGIEEGAELYAEIRTMDDVVKQSELAREFCLAQGRDARISNLISLFVEEIGGNIITHGRPRNGKEVSADFRLFVKEDKLCLTLRDYCEVFDPQTYYEIHKDDDPESNLGIRMVMKLAKDVRYINSFNTNCTMIII